MKMRQLITICSVVGVIMAVTGAAHAALDVDTIIMTSYKSYLDGAADTNPWCFEIWVDFIDTGDLDHIDVTLPGGSSSFTIDGGDWEYESIDYPSLVALQVDYPTGTYTFDFCDSGDNSLLSFGLGYDGLSEPSGPVDFNYPTHGATDVPLNPKLSWTVDSEAGDALYMWLENDDWYENGPVTTDTNSWQPGPLNPSHTYGFEVSVINVKGLEEGPAFPTMTVGGDEFTYGLWIEYLNEMEFTTIPEPATIALLGLGSLTLLGQGRKFNRR